MTTDTAALRVERTPAPQRPGSAGRLLRRHRLTLLLLAAALCVGVLGPLLLSWWTGSLRIPHNDSWAFSRSAEIFARTGHITLFNWNAMSLVGAFVPFGPLARTIFSQQCAIAVLSVLSLAAAFDVLRAVIGPRRAALGLLVLVIWPGFGLLSTSMMTDIPAFAATTLTLAVGRRAIERRSVPLFALTGLLGLWGFTIREQTIAAAAGVLGAALLRPHLRERRMLVWYGVIALVLGAAAGVFELWRRALPNGSSPTFSQISYPGTKAVIESSVGGVLLLGLMVSPLVFLAARPLRWNSLAIRCSLATFIVTAGMVHWYGVHFPQNYFLEQGSYATAYLGNRPPIVPRTAWELLLPLACVSTSLLAGMLVERIRRIPVELALFLAVTAIGTLMEVVEGEILFDRYVFPAVLPVLALVLLEPLRPRERSRIRLGVAAGVGLFLTVITSMLTANALAFDAAVWRTAQNLVDTGAASPAYVDAGLDWDGYYSPDGAQNTPDPAAIYGLYDKADQLGHGEACYVIAASKQHQETDFFTLVKTVKYDKFGVPGEVNMIWVYRTYQPNCH